LRTGLFILKVCLLIFAFALLLSSLIDLAAALGPQYPGCGGYGCITIGSAGVTIEGVNFVGTLFADALAAVVTVAALTIDVIQQFFENQEAKSKAFQLPSPAG
jgi:hypothetical protein